MGCALNGQIQARGSSPIQTRGAEGGGGGGGAPQKYFDDSGRADLTASLYASAPQAHNDDYSWWSADAIAQSSFSQSLNSRRDNQSLWQDIKIDETGQSELKDHPRFGWL